MNIAEYLSDDLADFALVELSRHVSIEDAREAANNIRSLVHDEVRDAINNAIGAEQDRQTEDAVSERRGL